MFPTLLAALALTLQVPPPTTGVERAQELEADARAILARESEALQSLADRLTKQGETKGAAEVRKLSPPTPEGPATRLVPLPDVVEPRSGLASVAASGTDWGQDLEAIRKTAGESFFELATKAASAEPSHMARAGIALRETLARLPDHAEARRLLGYVPHDGGWAKPFAVRQLKDGNVAHPTYGWVPEDWVVHLELGELPAPAVRGKPTTWLPAAEADRLRSTWRTPWQINTEHFEIRADVPLAEAIQFGRRLEAFHDLFFALMADVVGDELPLARRFKSPSLAPDASYRPHQVVYYADRDEYHERMRPVAGEQVASESLGYYDPRGPGRGSRRPAYFFRDVDGQLPVEATLYHEVSHQLLFESAGPNAYLNNSGDYWVFEGLGTYFETVTPTKDGALEVGGLVGPRLEAALHSLGARKFQRLGDFLRQDQAAFNRDERIYVNYQQAMALTLFLMQAERGAYREPFLDYVRDAYRGRIKRGSGRSLEDRLGTPVDEIERRFRAFYAPAAGG
ncbi:DUF1570 domain-containing protein [Planctomyces sp. SH-PL62]|uniref:DUF1570 domain-containing protein n=1 Tax=Planctomyces sp. SH-PL62 TaxID=1636152 RepID=UPI00078C8019|nr:DUF1570 domain-containing protein [Planctomyces sp. SH-PL62]AMV37470.1 hypothetical protein VT85_08545 [Planctomyces sp. SH-PL62]